MDGRLQGRIADRKMSLKIPAIRFEGTELVLEITRHTERLGFADTAGWLTELQPAGTLAAQVLLSADDAIAGGGDAAQAHTQDLRRLREFGTSVHEWVPEDDTWLGDLQLARWQLQHFIPKSKRATRLAWSMGATGPTTDVLRASEAQGLRQRMQWMGPPAWDHRLVKASTPAAAVFVSLFEGFTGGGLIACPFCGTLVARAGIERRRKRCRACAKTTEARHRLTDLQRVHEGIRDRIRRRKGLTPQERNTLTGRASAVMQAAGEGAMSRAEAVQALEAIAPHTGRGRPRAKQL